MSKKLVCLHFNDVYNIEPGSQEPVGGAARLATLINHFEQENPLVLFSGDCFNPSRMSSFTRGKQMVPVLNALGVSVACLGNHDLDFGVPHFRSLIQGCQFPWLAANVIDKVTGKGLGDLEGSKMLDWEGIKIGVMGLVEEEWITTLSMVHSEEVEYRDFIETGRELARKYLDEGAELIIALTHMRQPNDVILLESVPEIDIVMGGHDHGYYTGLVETHRNLLIKSGTNFQDLTRISITLEPNGEKKYEWERLRATRDVAEDVKMKEIVDGFAESAYAHMDKVIGFTAVDLDGRFSAVRTGETNLGNLVCDILRDAARAEICFLNSGTLRSDRIHPRGSLKKRDLLDILPMVDETVVMHLTGKHLLTALENGVSQYPKLEGRFPQVSGISFAFDPRRPVGERIAAESVTILDLKAPLELDRVYTVCTKDYLYNGKDGFDVLSGSPLWLDCELSPVLPSVIRCHFMKLETLSQWKKEMRTPVESHTYRFAAQLKRAIGRGDATTAVSLMATFDDALQEYAVRPCKENRIVCLGAP